MFLTKFILDLLVDSHEKHQVSLMHELQQVREENRELRETVMQLLRIKPVVQAKEVQAGMDNSGLKQSPQRSIHFHQMKANLERKKAETESNPAAKKVKDYWDSIVNVKKELKVNGAPETKSTTGE